MWNRLGWSLTLLLYQRKTFHVAWSEFPSFEIALGVQAFCVAKRCKTLKTFQYLETRPFVQCLRGCYARNCEMLVIFILNWRWSLRGAGNCEHIGASSALCGSVDSDNGPPKQCPSLAEGSQSLLPCPLRLPCRALIVCRRMGREFCRLNNAGRQVGTTAFNKACAQVQGHTHYASRDKNTIISA